MCGQLFGPGAIGDFVSGRLAGRFVVGPHRHADVIQFDILDGCRGTVSLDGRGFQVAGRTLLVHYPGEHHGFDLRGGRRWHLKLNATGEEAVRRRVWPGLRTQLPPMPRLLRAAADVGSCCSFGTSPTPLLASVAAEVLARWPLRDASAVDAAAVEDDRDLAGAVRLAQDATGRPPTLAEMGRAAHLSPRHLARRFRTRFAMTPGEFADLGRLARAKALLQGRQLSVAGVAAAVGFASHSSFTRWFARRVGQTPRQFRLDPQAA